MNKPITTLYMIESLDGKISTGDNDKLDFDKDLPKIKGVKQGLYQYYNIEKTTDINSLNTGKVMKKIGMNSNKPPINCPEVNFIIIDNNHLTKKGVTNLINKTKKLFLITTNKNHPAIKLKENKKLEIIFYPKKINFKDLFKKLKQKYEMNRTTIQSGGTLNSILLRENLIDYVSVVIAPCIIGGKNTSTLADGESLHSVKELNKIKSLKLKTCKKLKNSYIHLIYEVVKK
jgi:2,5-diamino-6-(ribosylamino)-4(3H)-pyrimidinone 5'-phosphate reductase